MKKEKEYCVYIHTNKANNKKYIGISSNVKKRWAGQGSNYYDQVFGLAIKKYSWDGFVHDIIADKLTKEEACRMETELIKKYNTTNKEFGYNRSDGGESGSKGSFDAQLNRIVPVYQYTIEGSFVKKHISISSAIRELRPDYKGNNSMNISTCCKGKRDTAIGYRWFYEYQGEKISPLKDIIIRISEGEGNDCYQYSLNGEFLNKYCSYAQATRLTGAKTIRLCVNSETHYSNGFLWFNEYMGEKIPPYKKPKSSCSKTVYVYDDDKNCIAIYDSLKDVERNSQKDFGKKLLAGNVGSVCRNEKKSYKELFFSYKPL